MLLDREGTEPGALCAGPKAGREAVWAGKGAGDRAKRAMLCGRKLRRPAFGEKGGRKGCAVFDRQAE